MSRGIEWLVSISDDSDFSEMLRRAREANLGTMVVGDMDKALGRHADLWVPWIGVENGDIQEGDLMPKKMDRMRNEASDEFFQTRMGNLIGMLCWCLVMMRTRTMRIKKMMWFIIIDFFNKAKDVSFYTKKIEVE
ncbi:hypothetical protein RJT34_07690 [Clitoria ternatea]|uniref:Uncharacterized protein n=1 Tax=Clitoria ternatea TaxID=43366 RepID=A0AAN9PV23_CLITE